MLGNIWISVRRRDENYPFRDLSKMHFVCLAVILSVTTCLANDDLQYNKAMLRQQVEDKIRLLREAKQRAELQEQKTNSLAVLADQMIKDSFESQLQSKMDILYENNTDLTKELNFTSANFNCGKEFDIFKLLDLAKAHRSITTESPRCLEELEEPSCVKSNEKGSTNGGSSSTGRANGGINRNVEMTPKGRFFKSTNPPPKGIEEVPSGILPNRGVSTATAPLAQPQAEKKSEAKPQAKPIKTKIVDNKPHSPVAEVIDDTSDIGGKMMDQQPGLESVHIPQTFEHKGIIAKPAAAIRSTPTKKAIQAQSEYRQAANFPTALELEQDQLPQKIHSESRDFKVQDHNLNANKMEVPVSKDLLQHQQSVRATSSVIQAISQPMEIAKPPLAATEASNLKLQGINLSASVEPIENRMPIVENPAKVFIKAQQQQPQAFKPLGQTSEKANQVFKSMNQASEHQNQGIKTVTQILELQPQNVKSMAYGSEQMQAAKEAMSSPNQQQHAVLTSVQGSEQQPQAVIPAAEVSEQEQALKQKLNQPLAVKPSAAVVSTLLQQVVKPTATIVQAPAKQVGQPEGYVQQLMAKQPSLNPLIASMSGHTKALAAAAGKIPVISPPDPLLMDSYSYSSGTPQKSQLAPQNAPSRDLLGYNVVPNVQGLRSSVHLQNNLLSVTNKLENRKSPGNLQYDPNMDYIYYQE